MNRPSLLLGCLCLALLTATCAESSSCPDAPDAAPGPDAVTADVGDASPDTPNDTPEAEPGSSAEALAEVGPDATAPADTADAAEAAPTDTAPPAPQPFKVLSFNLRTGFADDGADSWKDRQAIVTSFLQAEAPDLVGVQEGLIFQLTVVGEALPDHDWVGTDRTGTGLDEYCAVFYDRLRFELVASGTFWLSDTPDVVASTFSDAQLRTRIVTWARLRERATGRELVLFNTHYDTTDQDQVPERSSALVVKKIAELAGDTPVVLTGDFNTLVGEPAYDILVGVEAFDGVTGALIDPWRELGLPEEGSFHGFDGVANDTTRIDWILHTYGVTAEEAVVSHYQVGGHYPSDHFPVWARLTLP
jgi:endonuclease/exonuclease/phosphatase family metal-dependent hydrolase